jgi:selenocysteine-specific elongation factor
MKSVIVGTAGHIDHGKTALVKALTGIDADRLQEEKRRGITIDLGFAHLELPGSAAAAVAGPGSPGSKVEPLRLGFVDVPGHERFVRNMLAGIGGIDLVLLVIAADESIKPQTREHFDICRMLNIRRGMAVLTKADLVDSDTLEVVRLEVEDFLRGSFLEGAPILAASSLTGQGLESLVRELAQLAKETPSRDARAVFRLPVDRVFSMKGFGTVVTGTLISGSVRKEEEVEVFPGGKRVRIRGIQVHGTSAEEASAGQRTALNLAGASTDELLRGMMLAPAGRFHATTHVDVQVTILPGARTLRTRSRVHFHGYTAETVAEVILLAPVAPPEPSADTGSEFGDGSSSAEPTRTSDQERPGASQPAPVATRQARLSELRPGQTAWAKLRLASPVLLFPGDRFILRQFSPVVTIGGGVVADAAPTPLSRAKKLDTALYLRRLEVMASGSALQQLITRVARRDTDGLTLADLIAETGWTQSRLNAVLGQAVATPAQFQKEIQSIKPASGAEPAAGDKVLRFGDVLLSDAVFMGTLRSMLGTVEVFHRGHPLVVGISREELREKLNLGPEVFSGVLDALVREKRLQVTGEQVHQAGRGVVMKDDEADSKRRIEEAFAGAGLKVPALKEVLAGVKLDRARAQQIVTLLLRDRILIKVSDDLVFHHTALEQLRRLLAEYKKTSTKIDVGKFKDLAGVSRKYAIPLLEYLDRERVTRRVGDERIIG